MDISYKIKIGKPFKGNILNKLKSFLLKNDLTYDTSINYSIIIENSENNIIATGSLDNNIIKCIAIDNNYRNENLSSIIISNIIRESIETEIKNLFIFTKPLNELIFKQFGFYTIEKTNNVLLMESDKNGFSNYLSKIKKESIIAEKSNNIGCIIANCNPFTKGHLYLFEKASKQCEFLHVFILSGNNNYFTEKERYNLVQKGLKNLNNVIIHNCDQYLLSPLTFPNYFIKDKVQSANINCELDIKIFLNMIAPLLNIKYRFVGTEPKDIVTNSYNNALKTHLNNSSVELIIIERKKIDETVISASKVRELIKNNELEEIKKYVPKTTYDFIKLKFFNHSDSK